MLKFYLTKMPKQQELSNFASLCRNKSNILKSDPFYIIYNHRKATRAKTLKKIKLERRIFERNLMFVENQTEKEENIKNWNQSML